MSRVLQWLLDRLTELVFLIGVGVVWVWTRIKWLLGLERE